MSQLASYWNTMANQYIADKAPDPMEAFSYEVGRALPQFINNLDSYEKFHQRYDNDWSQLEYMGNEQRIAQLELEKDILAEREDPTGRFAGVTERDLDTFSPEDLLMKDQNNNWIRLRDNLEESVAYTFQNESRKTMLGQTTHGISRDIQNLVLSLDDEVADSVFPISAETQSIIDEWGDLGNAPMEAFFDLARSISPWHERRVLFRYDNPILSHIRTPDENWTEEARERAWTLLNNSPRYGSLMEKMGLTKDDVMNTVSGLELRYNINNRRNTLVAQNVVSQMPLTKDLNTFMVWSKRFIVDNFINDPDTAVEVGAAAGMFALGFVTGGTTWIGTAALLGKIGTKSYKGITSINAIRRTLEGIGKTANVVRSLPKFLPTQVVSEIVFPTVKGLRAGQGFRKSLTTAINNPDKVSWGQFLMGAGIEGGISEFGAYFVNLAELKELNDQVYGEGNHLVEFRYSDLFMSMGMGVVFSAALGSTIRGAAAGAAKVDMFNAAGKAVARQTPQWLLNLKRQRNDMVADWYLMEWTGKYDRGSLAEDGDFMAQLDSAKSRGYDISTRLREVNSTVSKKKRGKLTLENAKELIKKDIRKFDESVSKTQAAILKAQGKENQAAQSEISAEVARQEVDDASRTEASTSQDRTDHMRRTMNRDEPEAVANHDAQQKREREINDELENTPDTEANAEKRQELQEELEVVQATRKELAEEIARNNPTWRVDRVRKIKGNRVTRQMQDLRELGNGIEEGQMTKGMLREVFRGRVRNNEVIRNAIDEAPDDKIWTKKEFNELIDNAEEQALADAHFINRDDENAEIGRSMYGKEWIDLINQQREQEAEARNALNLEANLETFQAMQVRTDVEASEQTIKNYNQVIGRRYDGVEKPYPDQAEFMSSSTKLKDGTRVLALDDDVILIFDPSDNTYRIRTEGVRLEQREWEGFPDSPTSDLEFKKDLTERYNMLRKEFGEQYPDIFDEAPSTVKGKPREKFRADLIRIENLLKKQIAFADKTVIKSNDGKRHKKITKAIREYRDTPYATLVGDSPTGRIWQRRAEAKLGRARLANEHIRVVDDAMRGLAMFRSKGFVKLGVDSLHMVFPDRYRSVFEKIIEDAGLIDDEGLIDVEDLNMVLLTRLAEVDPNIRKVSEVRAKNVLKNLMAETPVGHRKNVVIGKLEAAKELHLANKEAVVRAVAEDEDLRQIELDGTDRQGRNARESIIKAMNRVFEEGTYEDIRILNRIMDDLELDVEFDESTNLADSDLGEMILQRFEEKYLRPNNVKDINDFGNGVEGISTPEEIGEGIIDMYRGIEGHSREQMDVELDYHEDQLGRPVSRYHLGAILRRNNAAPQTTARVVELHENFVGHARANQFLRFDPETGDFVELTPEDLDGLEEWLADENKIANPLDKYGTGTRLIPKRAYVDPRETLPDLEELQRRAFDDMVKLPPVYTATVHDSITIANPALWGTVPGGRPEVDWDVEDVRGLTFGFSTLVALPGGFMDAQNRAMELMFPATSGLVERARVEAEDLLVKRGKVLSELSEDEIRKEMVIMLADGEIGKMKIPTEKEVVKQWEDNKGSKLTDEELKEAKANHKARSEAIAKINEQGIDYMDANGSGPNIIQLHANINKLMGDNPSLLAKHREFAAKKAPDLYLEVQNSIVKEFDADPSLSDTDPVGKWWRDNIFSTEYTKSDVDDIRDGKAKDVRGLMKSPVMTIPYNAGRRSLKNNTLDWLKTWAKTDEGKAATKDWTPEDFEKHAEWLGDKMVSSGATNGLNGSRGWVREALNLPEGEELKDILYGDTHTFVYRDLDGNSQTADLSTMSQAEMEKVALSFAGNQRSSNSMINLSLATIALRGAIVKQRFRGRYTPEQVDKLVNEQIMPMVLSRNSEELAEARQQALQQSTKTQGLNAIFRAGFKIRADEFNDVRVNRLGHKDSNFMVMRDGEEVELLGSDVHPVVRLNQQMGLFADWTRTLEGRVMTPGVYMNVQGASYSRIYDRVEHQKGLYEIDVDHLIDSSLDEDGIKHQIRQRVVLDTSLRVAKTYEPPTVGGRKYQDPSMEEFVSYTLQRDRMNQDRFKQIQEDLRTFGKEEDIEIKIQKAMSDGNDVLVKELQEQLAFVKAYRSLAFAPIVERPKGQMTDQDMTIYQEGGYLSPHNTLGGPEGSMPEVNRYGHRETVGIPLFRQLAIEKNPVAVKLKETTERVERLGVGSEKRNVFSLEEMTHVSSKDLNGIPSLELGNEYIGMDSSPSDWRDMSVGEKSVQMKNDLDRFQKRYRIDDDQIKQIYYDVTTDRKYDGDLELANTDRYLVLYLLKKRNDWKIGRDKAVHHIRQKKDLINQYEDINNLYRQWDARWQRFAAQWAQDAGRERSIVGLDDTGGFMADAADTPEAFIRKITPPDIENARAAWLFPDAINSGQVIANPGGFGKPSPRADSGMTARIIQTNDSTYLIVSHAEFEFGIQALYKARYGKDGTTEDYRKFVEEEMQRGVTKEEFDRAVVAKLTENVEGLEDIGDIDMLMYVDRGHIDPRLLNDTTTPDTEMGSLDSMAAHDVVSALAEHNGVDPWAIRTYINAFGEELSTVNKVTGGVRVALTFNEKVKDLMSPASREAVDAMEVAKLINAENMPVGMSRSASLDARQEAGGLAKTITEYRDEAGFEAAALAKLIGEDRPNIMRLRPDTNLKKVTYAGADESVYPSFVNWDPTQKGYDVDKIDAAIGRIETEDLLEGLTDRRIVIDGVEVSQEVSSILKMRDKPGSKKEHDLIVHMYSAGVRSEAQYEAINPEWRAARRATTAEEKLVEQEAHRELRTRVLAKVQRLQQLKNKLESVATEEAMEETMVKIIRGEGPNPEVNIQDVEDLIAAVPSWYPRGMIEDHAKRIFIREVRLRNIADPEEYTVETAQQIEQVQTELTQKNGDLTDRIEEAETGEDSIVNRILAVHDQYVSEGKRYKGPASHLDPTSEGPDTTKPAIRKALGTGTAVDLFVRDVFAGDVKSINAYRISNDKPRWDLGPLFKNQDEMDLFRKQVELIKDEIEADGSTIVSDEITFHDKYMQMEGTTDIIVITPDNKLRIYDVKALRKEKLTNKLEGKFNEDDAYTEGQRYQHQLSAYAYMAQKQLGLEVESIGLIPIIRDGDSVKVEKIDGEFIYPMEILDEIKSNINNYSVKRSDLEVKRDSPPVYQGWDRPVTNKYGIFFSTADGIIQRLDDPVKGPAFDNGIDLSSRNIYEVTVTKELEYPESNNDLLGRAEDVIVLGRVDPVELESLAGDTERKFIFSTRDDLAEGTIVTAEDKRGQRSNIESMNREQVRNVRAAGDRIEKIKRDKKKNKGMDYIGKEDVFASTSTTKQRLNRIVNVLSEPDETGRSFLSKKEAKLLRQILATWEGTDLLHDVIFKVENTANGDFSGRFRAKFDPKAQDFIRSIRLIADTVKDEDGVDLSAIDIVLHEIGHLVEHKLWAGPKSQDYHLTLAAFKDEASREGVLNLLKAMHKKNPSRAKQMYNHIYGRGEDNIDEGLSELFAQLFSYAMISKSMDSLNWNTLISSSGRADGVKTIAGMFASEAHEHLIEISAIMSKIRDSEGPLSELVRAIDTNYMHRPLKASQIPNRFSREVTRNAPADPPGPRQNLENELAAVRQHLADRGDNATQAEINTLLAKQEDLLRQLRYVANRGTNITDPEFDINTAMKESIDSETGLMVIDEYDQDVQNAMRHQRLIESQFTWNGNSPDLVFEGAVGTMAPKNLRGKARKGVAAVATPFTGRSLLEHGDFDILRFFGAMTDEQNIYIDADYGRSQGMPTLQQMMISHHGKWDQMAESLLAHIQESKDRFENVEDLQTFMNNLSQYYISDPSARADMLSQMPEGDREFVKNLIERFELMYDRVLDDIEATGKLPKAMVDNMRRNKTLPIRMNQDFYLDGKEAAATSFTTALSQRMNSSDMIDPDALAFASGSGGKDTALLPNPRRENLSDAEIEGSWNRLNEQTKANLIQGYINSDPQLASTWDVGSIGDIRNVYRWAYQEAKGFRLKKSVFAEEDLMLYTNAIDNTDAINEQGYQFVLKEYRAKHPNLFSSSRNTSGDLNKMPSKTSAAGFQWFKMSVEMGTSAYMFSGNRYFTPQDIWNDPNLSQHIEKNLGSIMVGIQKGIGWDAYSTRAFQEFTGIQGYGYMQMLRDAQAMFANKQHVKILNSEGQEEIIEITTSMRKRIDSALHHAERRYQYAGRSIAGIADHASEVVNFIHDWGVRSVLAVNGPNFLPASLLVELPLGLFRRIARNAFTKSDEKLLAGLVDGLSPKKQREVLSNLAITAHYHRNGLSSGQLATAANEGVEEMWKIIQGRRDVNAEGRIARAADKATPFATLGFGRVQLGMRAMEIMPAQQRLNGDIEKLMKLRDLVNERRSDWKDLPEGKAKKAFRQAVRDAKFGSLRYENVDEYYRLGLLEDHYLEQMQSWLDSQEVMDNVIDLEPMIMDMYRTTDRAEYAKKERTMTILQNYLHNAATKTNLEQRVSSAPVGVEDKLTAIMARLTSYTTMFFQHVARRNFHTAAPAAITGMFMAYMMMEQLYAKMMDLARGRSWDEISKEYTEDPIGSLIGAAARIPVLGWAQFPVSGMIEKARQWLGQMDSGIGYADAMTSPGIVGLSGAEVSLNSLIGGAMQLITIPTELLLGQEPSSSSYFRAARAVPVPMRPVLMASIGVLMGEQQMKNSGMRTNSRYLNSSSMMDAAGFSDNRPLPRPEPSVRQKREEASQARRRQFASELRGAPKRGPKAPETKPPAPSRQATDVVERIEQDATSFRPIPESLDQGG